MEQQWRRSLETYVYPAIGHVRVDQISAADVLGVLEPLWEDRHDTAVRLRGRMRIILGRCRAHGYVRDVVAGRMLDGAMPARPKVQHHRALPFAELPEALVAVAASAAPPQARACLRFVALTAARLSEASRAEWGEIDMEDRMWRVPSARMKNGEEHRQPLSGPALDLLRAARGFGDGEYVFPSPRFPRRCIGARTVGDALRTAGLDARTTIHGLRSTFRVWAAENTDADHAVMELSLAHRVGDDVLRAYLRSDLREKRRSLMEEWGAFATGQT